ncbi:hypothetical protein I2494_14965 [Budviciaceae bacterium BWR-B9]|uniref:Uncharacterized protein n=1 Tax=Limnobaculum allomyrinae TaxID=2791986 RepID=A0ABS1ITB8_9GAMM|nr:MULTISPECIES: hypothetical protein [Limnobaculum]MBK5144996.1 hypothetical protein [Limnobaculum allomyrinae]MBV7692827.1 hypothetical protein [Limnobaculum sp. M2-1]
MKKSHLHSLFMGNLFFAGLVMSGSLFAAEYIPSLEKTRLFTEITHDCRDVVLKDWKPATRDVLAKYDVDVTAAKVCNGGDYPVFYVSLKYDPQGQTADFYQPFYEAMKKANKDRPYSMVSDLDELIINVTYGQMGETRTDFERFQPCTL